MKDGVKLNDSNRLYPNINRTPKQVQRDAKVIVELISKGHAISDIPVLLQQKTDAKYRLLFSQVVAVFEDAYAQWWHAAGNDHASQLLREIARLEMLEQEAWECHNKAKVGVQIATEDWTYLDDEVSKNELKKKKNDKVKNITGIGKSEFMKIILRCIEMRVKLKTELMKIGKQSDFPDVITINFRHPTNHNDG